MDKKEIVRLVTFNLRAQWDEFYRMDRADCFGHPLITISEYTSACCMTSMPTDYRGWLLCDCGKESMVSTDRGIFLYRRLY